MNPPSAMTRFIGTPRVAAALYVVCASAVLGWFGGAVPWWVGIIALMSMGTVNKAARKIKTYDAWFARWHAMGGYPAPVVAPRRRIAKASSTRRRVVSAALLLIFIPLVMRSYVLSDAAQNAFTLLWLTLAAYLLYRVAAWLHRPRRLVKARASSSAARTEAEDVVEWALPPAASSPSRSDAVRSLPDYAARVLASGGEA